MATLQITLSDDELQQLAQAAAGREMTADALVSRWVRERLAHERERAAGGSRPQSPRARRGSAADGDPAPASHDRPGGE